MIVNANALHIPLADNSVHCCITSPPYYGLRDYGQDGQLGLEATPEQYIANMVAVFREVRRVMRPDATLWCNIGDAYAHSSSGGGGAVDIRKDGRKITPGDQVRGRMAGANTLTDGLKPKDLIGIPWMLAFALRQPYYTGRIKDERDRYWLAATLDAEGTICGFQHERPDGNIRTGILVFITNSDTRLLDHADMIWPGARYIDHNHVGDHTNISIATRDSFRWQIQQAEERSQFIAEIYPYLISKKEQALIAWNVLQYAIAAKHMGRGGETKEVKDKRILLMDYLSRLNHAEHIDLPSWLKKPPSLTEPGFYLRSDIIWSKNNPMPESVTDRPTKAHEYVFLLTKRATYYYDQEAVREEYTNPLDRWGGDTTKETDKTKGNQYAVLERPGRERRPNGNGRNRRTVWTIATEPYPGSHFATFPQALVKPCLLAGSSDKGVCSKCGAPWEREIDRTPPGKHDSEYQTIASGRGNGGDRSKHATPSVNTTTGWRATCACNAGDPVPALIFDPFSGSGTVGLVAKNYGRRFVGLDLKLDYCRMAMERIGEDALQMRLGV